MSKSWKIYPKMCLFRCLCTLCTQRNIALHWHLSNVTSSNGFVSIKWNKLSKKVFYKKYHKKVSKKVSTLMFLHTKKCCFISQLHTPRNSFVFLKGNKFCPKKPISKKSQRKTMSYQNHHIKTHIFDIPSQQRCWPPLVKPKQHQKDVTMNILTKVVKNSVENPLQMNRDAFCALCDEPSTLSGTLFNLSLQQWFCFRQMN